MQTNTPTVELFLNYPFDTDSSYQQGLAGIIANAALEGKQEEEREDIFQRTRLFYYNRITGGTITVDDVQRHQSSVSAAAKTATGDPDLSGQPARPPEHENEPRALTFAELKVLIESGKTDQIPNNKVIPNDLHTAPPSVSNATARKKPWESAQVQAGATMNDSDAINS